MATFIVGVAVTAIVTGLLLLPGAMVLIT